MISNRPDLGLTDADYKTWFSGIDADADNTISKEELVGYLTGIDYTHAHGAAQ